METFFKIKTYTACNSGYKHNNEITSPADRRGREARKQYARKFKKLDQMFASEAVGDGTNRIAGPFKSDQGRFYTGQVIPSCTG